VFPSEGLLSIEKLSVAKTLIVKSIYYKTMYVYLFLGMLTLTAKEI